MTQSQRLTEREAGTTVPSFVTFYRLTDKTQCFEQLTLPSGSLICDLKSFDIGSIETIIFNTDKLVQEQTC
ncbi:hypothetical protein STRDD11_00077 [Streptococcus sp. DD11]|nr:hypothetical protein STRDD11_00077 [Streptococcus sp. DD11]